MEWARCSLRFGAAGRAGRSEPDAAQQARRRAGTVRNALNLANANRPKGQVANDTELSGFSTTTTRLFTADEYRPSDCCLYHNGAPVRLGDVAEVQDSVADVHNLGLANGKPGVLVVIFRQPGANVIETVDRVRALMPYLQSSISPAIKLAVVIGPHDHGPGLGEGH